MTYRVLFIKEPKRIFLMLPAEMDIKGSCFPDTAESISQFVNNSIDGKWLNTEFPTTD